MSTTDLPAASPETPDGGELLACEMEANDLHHHLVQHGARPGSPILRDLDRIVTALRDAEARAGVLEADAEYAAGECLVPMPEPGTDLARVLLANSQLRRQRDAAHKDLTAAESNVEAWMRVGARQASELARLSGDLEAARKDTARWAWYREMLTVEFDQGEGAEYLFHWDDRLEAFSVPGYGRTVDEMVDAMIAAAATRTEQEVRP